jgi:hypothetical protein
LDANLTPVLDIRTGGLGFRTYADFVGKALISTTATTAWREKIRAAPWIRRSPRTFAFTCGETCTCWQGAVSSFLIPTPETSLLSMILPRPKRFFGIGFFNDKKNPVDTLASKPYIRLAHGWGTESNLSEILSGNTEKDPYNNQLTSVFFGVPLADELFTLPIATYLTPGIVHHHASDVQDRSTEWVLAVKFYYTIKWPTPWRLGFAEGLSYVDRIPYLEEKDMQEKGYRPSQLLNFLDFSVDMDLGQLFRVQWMEDLWLGYSIHHRSGIFSTSSAFGRISGGSNYNTVYFSTTGNPRHHTNGSRPLSTPGSLVLDR